MIKRKTKITFQITFELEDINKLIESFPNFRYNYASFEEWIESNINNMLDSIKDIEGFTTTVEETIQRPRV